MVTKIAVSVAYVPCYMYGASGYQHINIVNYHVNFKNTMLTSINCDTHI